jgi:hypothetical protein
MKSGRIPKWKTAIELRELMEVPQDFHADEGHTATHHSPAWGMEPHPLMGQDTTSVSLKFRIHNRDSLPSRFLQTTTQDLTQWRMKCTKQTPDFKNP